MGASDDRIFAVAAWRDTSHFSDAERSALALGEAVTGTSDLPNPVPDQIWNAASRHYDQTQLATLLLAIAGTNFFNGLQNAVRTQAPGQLLDSSR